MSNYFIKYYMINKKLMGVNEILTGDIIRTFLQIREMLEEICFITS